MGNIPSIVCGLKAPKSKRPDVYDLIVMVVKFALVVCLRVAIVVDRLESVIKRINKASRPLGEQEDWGTAAETDYADR